LTGEAQAQIPETPIIEVGGYLWNRTTISVLIVSNNQSDWTAGLVNSTIRAIDDWNTAITYFATNYSGFSYLSAVNLQIQVSNQTESNFDVYVNFSETVASGNQDAIGATTTSPYSNGTIQKCIITIATESRYSTLTQKDIQSVAAHEFGHVLGIGHSNSSNDLMYPLFDVYGSDYGISTLDMYGVANAFQWIINPDQPVPSTKQELSLPTNITYEYIALAQPAPQAITDNPIVKALEILSNILLTPYILLMIASGILLLILIELFFRRARKAKNRKNPKA
jgi:hypothetical protein